MYGTETYSPKNNRMNRRLRERLAREDAERRNEGGQLMKGTRTHKTDKDYDRKQAKRELRNYREMD